MRNVGQIIADNLASLRQRIDEAAQSAGRSADEVKLVAVTKYVSAEMAQTVAEAGCLDLGESRPQQLWAKADLMSDLDVCWHMVGHLQRNKVDRTLPIVGLIHSGDSLRLLKSLDQSAASLTLTPRVLLEVNVSGDSSKHGFAADELEAGLDVWSGLPHLRIEGLMCMAGWGTETDAARRQFAELRELRDRLRRQLADCGRTDLQLDQLSMGMSGDFEQAIAEGATIVRVGSALFEGIDL